MSIKHLNILLVLLWSLQAVSPKAVAQQSVSFQIFYDELSPYGIWVNDPVYGYVWVPTVERGFAPYATNGYWASTDLGWTWVSDYPWGWAPFHYGRWYTDALYGPVWVPDYAWSPAWVSWRNSKSYYGWAPLPPGRGHGHHTDNSNWTFVKNQDFGKRDIQSYYVPASRNGTIMPYSTLVNNSRTGRDGRARYNAGPNRADVEKRAGRTITPMTIADRNAPGQTLTANQIQLFRPQLQASSSGSRPAPASISKWQDVKQRNAGTQKASAAKWRTQTANPSTDKWDNTQQSTQRAAPARQSTEKWNNAQPSTQKATPARPSARKWDPQSTQQKTSPAQPASPTGKWRTQPAPARQPAKKNGGG